MRTALPPREKANLPVTDQESATVGGNPITSPRRTARIVATVQRAFVPHTRSAEPGSVIVFDLSTPKSNTGFSSSVGAGSNALTIDTHLVPCITV